MLGYRTFAARMSQPTHFFKVKADPPREKRMASARLDKVPDQKRACGSDSAGGAEWIAAPSTSQ